MTNSKFTIAPEYRFKEMFSYLLFALGLVFILFSVFTYDGGIGLFFGVMLFIVGLLYLIFTSKQYLTIDNEKIILEKRTLVKVFDDELITIKRIDIKEVFYLRRQIMLGNIFVSKPYGDYDDKRIINPERIVIELKEKRGKTILRIGDKEQFHQAYEFIKKSITKQNDNN